MRALTRISAGNRKVFQGFVSGYGFSHIETSATMTALAAAVAPDRRGIEFQIVAARIHACRYGGQFEIPRRSGATAAAEGVPQADSSRAEARSE